MRPTLQLDKKVVDFNLLRSNIHYFLCEMVNLLSPKKWREVLIASFLLFSISGYSQTETFNSGIPATWAITSNQTVTNNWVHTATGGLSLTGGATVDPATNNTVGSTAEYFLITPQLVTPANGEIRFYTKQGSFSNKGTTFQVRISTANQPDISSFNVVLQSWTEAQLNQSATTYEEKIVSIPSIPAGIPIYIAFVAVTNQTGTSSTAGDKWFVDNVRLITSCAPVTGISTAVAATSAAISWTHPTATSFGIEVVPQGAGHGSVGTPVTGTTYTATGLTPQTTYDVYIRTNCDPDTSSTWAGPFSFTTATVGLTCPSSIEVPADVNTTPFVYSNNLANFYDADTYVQLDSQVLACQPPATPSTWNLLLGNHAYFSFTPATTGLVNITQSVAQSGATNNCYNASSSVFVFDGCAGVGTSAGCLGAITTESNRLTNSLNNFYVTAGNTYIILVSSNYQHTNPGAGICFTLTIGGSTCPAPAVVTLDNLQQTSALASWNNVQSLMNAWEYLVLPATDGAPTASQAGIPTNTNVNNPVINLTAGTQYNLYVRSVCGGIPGSWSVPLFFTTQCNPLPIPYYTGFTNANATNPEPCWSVLNLNNDTAKFNFGNSGSSEPVLKLSIVNAAGTYTNDMAITPTFYFDGVTQKRLRFKFKGFAGYVNNTGYVLGEVTYVIKLSTAGVGEANFTTVIAPLQTYETGNNWVEKVVPIPANIVGNINIAWHIPPGNPNTATQFYLDDVYIEDLPACSEPSYPIITPGSITNTSLELSWTNGYNNTQWQIVAQPQGTGTPTTSGILVDTNPYTLTGLTPSTRYEIYVRAYCNATEQSIWAGPIFFYTLCDPQPTPYYESLNTDDITSKKFCWTTRNVADDIAEWRINATEASIQPQGQFMNPFVSYDDWLISVPINVVGQKRLRFKYRAAASIFYQTVRGNLEVLMSSTPDFATYTTLIPSHDFTNGAYEEDSVLFTGTGTTYIAFRVPPTMTEPSNSCIVMVDDVVIDDAPACPDPNPANMHADNITTTTANLSWTAGYTETQWQIAIQSPLSGVPTGSGTTVDTTPTYNAVGLTPDTPYEFYVRAVCSATESSNWVGPFPFRTICNALPTPFLETFDSNSATKTCWTIENVNADSNFWNLNQPANPIFGDRMASLFTGDNGNNNDYLITPTLMARPNQRLRFHFKTRSDFFEEDLKVMLSTTGPSSDQFSNILYENSLSADTDATGIVAGTYSFTLASAADAARVHVGDFIYIPGFPFGWPPYVVSVVGNVVTLDRIAEITQSGVQNVQFNNEVINNPVAREMVINLTDITVPTNINLAFHTPYFPPNPWAYRGQFTFIDNVIVEDIPACSSVINVTTNNIIDTTADINWEVIGSETSWEISVQPFGTPAPIGDTLPEYLVTTSTHPKTITNLIPSTQYQYYIRSVCSGSSQSEWVGPFTFITKCDYSNVCQYKMTVTNGTTGHVYDRVEVRQNGSIVQNLVFPYTGTNQPTSIDYDVFLCRGVEFSLYFNAGGGNGLQYSEAQIVIRDELNNIVWTSPLGLGTAYTNIYTAVASCGVVTCPQPTNVAINNLGTFTWDPVPGVSQYEVFIQPVVNGTIPQSGTIVSSTTYTPTTSDFVNPTGGTFEFFVRAICSATDKSFWTGPKVFIRNDESVTAVRLPANTGTDCDISGVDASFIGATVSTNPTTCAGNNAGDIWYDFVATAKVHTIELSDFGPGSYYASSYEGDWPKIMMALYEVQPDGSLLQKGCSEDNSMVTMYTKELVVGKIYKIRLSLDDPTITDKKFHICITTPEACDMNAFNYDFEKLPMQSVTGISTIINARVVPGWRVNTDWGTMFFNEASNSPGVFPYSGGQCVQLTHDNVSTWDPNSPNIKGVYRDFDTSEIPQMDYSFASATRGNGSTLQLYAGPPTGPFTLVVENFANSLVWNLVQGSYMVPTGQTTTRFIFRVKNYTGGHLLDAANFIPNTDIITTDATLDCSTTTTTLSARGVGHWESDFNNPTVATIDTPNSTTTAISGITLPGSYIFHWKTRYCDKTVTITKQGNTETALVVNPTVYCLNATASPLTATVSGSNTVNWYTQAVGGLGSAIAPTPSTATVGNSQVFYAASVDGNGCEGPRAQIVVQVDDLPTATISGTTTICSGTTAVITFNGTPNAVVTYTVNSGSNQTITLDGAGSATLTTPTLTANASYDLVSVTSVGTNPCSQTQVGNALVTVEILPTATISGTVSVCLNSASPTITFTGANGTIPYTFTYTINGGANQTITTTTGDSVTLSVPTSSVGIFTYDLVSVSSAGIATCSQTQTGSAIVTIDALPTATISGTTTICSGTTAVITFNGTPNAVVTYTVNSGSNQTITLDGAGSATLTTPTLTANASYDLVSVTSVGTNPCSQTQVGNALVTVEILPTATISGTVSVCLNSASPTITFTGANGTIPYTFTYTINGGANQTITTTTGDSVTIAVPTSSVGIFTYDLVSVSSAGIATCSQTQTGSAIVTIDALPTATISGATTICTGGTAVITFTGTPNATVTYTVDGGSNQTIVLDGSGSVTLTTPVLTANSTYTLVSVASGTTTCSQTQTGSVVITVNQLTTPNVAFSYTQTCENATANPLPVLTPNFVTGGVFSSTTVTVNSTTGEVTLPAAVGSHEITYTLAANTTTCTAGAIATATLVITSGVTPVTGFSYDTNYCLTPSAPNALPVTATGFTTGGTYTATPSGLIINSTTGEITISGSQSGTYTVVYTIAANATTCTIAGSSNFTVTISAIPVVQIDDICENQVFLLEALPVNDSFNPDDVSYTWSVSNIPVLGSNASTFNVDDYLEQNPSVSLPLVFSVSVSLSGCDGSDDFEVAYNPCRKIPRGISPNDDGDNDTFDLTGMGVKEITIFNRYGTNVYSHSGTYTNQWEGQSDQGDELPDGTYFYSIHTIDGASKTGWVYINRQY